MAVLLKTEAGVSLLPPTYVLPVLSRGEVKEKYLSELRVGDILLFRKDAPPTSLDEVKGILYSEVPGYREARNFCYARSDGYETTKLRRDLIKALSQHSPNLFVRGEIERLESLVFRKDGNDFSPETLGMLTEYLFAVLDEHGVQHSKQTYRKWLNGDIIHPEDHKGALKVAEILGSQELIDRAEQILSDPPIQNQYRNLVATHRVTMSLLALPKATGTGTSTRPAREYEEIPRWYIPALEKLRPRMEENIVEVKLLGLELVEKEPGEVKEEKTRLGLRKGVIGYTLLKIPEILRIYEKLRFPSVKSRRERLKEDLDARLKLFEECLLFTHKFCLEKLAEGIRNSSLLPYLINTYIILDIDKKSFGTEAFSLARILHPSFNYSTDTEVKVCHYFIDKFEQAIDDRRLRRELLLDLRKGLPSDHPLYPYYSSVYRNSIFLRSILGEKRFVSRVTDKIREFDINDICEIKLFSGSNKENIRTGRCLSRFRLGEALASLEDLLQQPLIQNNIPKMKELDARIPPEILSLFTPSTGFPDIPVSDPISEKILGGFGLGVREYDEKSVEMCEHMTAIHEKVWKEHNLPPFKEVVSKLLNAKSESMEQTRKRMLAQPNF